MDTDLIELKRSLTPQDLETLRSELDRIRKSAFVAYLLWFFFGTLGLHKFYLGRIRQGLLYISWPCIALVTLILFPPPAAIIALIGFLIVFLICWLVDLFTLHEQTEAANETLERTILRQMKGPAA